MHEREEEYLDEEAFKSTEALMNEFVDKQLLLLQDDPSAEV